MTAHSSPQLSSDLFQHLISFCQKLRDEGVKVTLHREIDTFRSLKYIDIFNFTDFYHSLKTNLISCREEITVFDRIFFSYWDFFKRKHGEERGKIEKEKNGNRTAEEEFSFSGEEKLQSINITKPSGDDAKKEPEARETPLYSRGEKLQEKDFSSFSDEDIEEIKKAIFLLTRKIQFRESRRKKINKKGQFFDFRKTIRKNIRYGGDLLKLAWKSRKVTRTRIVLICDVSGSMESYIRFLIQFLYGLQNSLGRVETFVFSTRLSRITTFLRREGFENALTKISRTILDWSGGTRIGECLHEFNIRYSPNLLYGKTVVIIISDGWDRGDENHLRKEMGRLKKNAYHLIWLNPLLSSPQYQPICKGMRTALPFLDQFLPLYNLSSLHNLGNVLYRVI